VIIELLHEYDLLIKPETPLKAAICPVFCAKTSETSQNILWYIRVKPNHTLSVFVQYCSKIQSEL